MSRVAPHTWELADTEVERWRSSTARAAVKGRCPPCGRSSPGDPARESRQMPSLTTRSQCRPHAAAAEVRYWDGHAGARRTTRFHARIHFDLDSPSTATAPATTTW